jgi:integrase
VQLLMLTGVRIGELGALDVDDVRLTQRTGELIIRHGKGDRRRVVPLNRPARAALREWLADGAAHHSRPSLTAGPLWISRTGEPLLVRSLSKIVTAVMAKAGLDESAHALRHTVATRLVREHAHDLVLVADILGHADIKATRRYARSDLEQRRAAPSGARRPRRLILADLSGEVRSRSKGVVFHNLDAFEVRCDQAGVDRSALNDIPWRWRLRPDSLRTIGFLASGSGADIEA